MKVAAVLPQAPLKRLRGQKGRYQMGMTAKRRLVRSSITPNPVVPRTVVKLDQWEGGLS